MKKVTKIKNWLFVLISSLFPSEKPNLKKNETEILNLLFYSNFNELETQETLSVFNNVKVQLEKRISDRKSLRKLELTAINDFDGTNQQQIEINHKQIDLRNSIRNPIFDLPVKDFKIVEYAKA